MMEVILLSLLGGGTPSSEGIYILLLGNEGRTENFSCLCCLHLKITFMPKWQMLGWHILILFKLQKDQIPVQVYTGDEWRTLGFKSTSAL